MTADHDRRPFELHRKAFFSQSARDLLQDFLRLLHVLQPPEASQLLTPEPFEKLDRFKFRPWNVKDPQTLRGSFSVASWPIFASTY